MQSIMISMYIHALLQGLVYTLHYITYWRLLYRVLGKLSDVGKHIHAYGTTHNRIQGAQYHIISITINCY